MFCLFLIIGLAIFSAFSYWRVVVNKKNEEETDHWESFVGPSRFIACIVLFASFVALTTNYYRQLDDFQTVKKLCNKEKIYKDKAESLTREFAGYLATAYPEHEKNIFSSISPDNIKIYLAKYPELRNADTIMALVTEISKMQPDYYNQRLLREDVLKNIRFRTINPWIFHWWIPTLPELEAKYGKLPK